MAFRFRWIFLPALAVGLAGCASLPADWGRADVAGLTAAHGQALPPADQALAFTTTALQTPLSAETAVQLALLNNPELRRQTAGLGFAAAQVYEAGHLANPVFSASRLATMTGPAGQGAQFTLSIAFNFVNLLFLPSNTRLAQAQFEAAKLSVAATVIDLAAQVQAAWYEAVAARQLAQMREAAARIQRASATLAQRYFDAGNISPRELAMEQAAASQTMLTALSASAAAQTAHLKLNRLMGLSADQAGWTLDARLQEPLAEEEAAADLQQLAMRNRLDVESLRQNARALATRYRLTRHTRLINGVELGVTRERDYDGAINLGPTLSLELPLFNWGGGRVAAAQATLQQVEAELDARVLDASNDVSRQLARVESARAMAALYKTALVPQRETVLAEAQKEHNYMLIGVFELILAKQQEYDAYAGYIEAVRDYWIARSELARAVGRRLPGDEQPTSPTLDPTGILPPAASPDTPTDTPPQPHAHRSQP